MGTGNGNGGSPKAKQQQVETRKLPVKLTSPELLKRGDELAACELGIEELKIKRSKVNAQIQEQIKERTTLAHTIDRGTEDRDVKCTWVEDFPKNVYRLKRDDDGKEVDTRPMTAADRTGSLFATDKGGSDLGVPPPRSPKKRAPKKSAKPTTTTSATAV